MEGYRRVKHKAKKRITLFSIIIGALFLLLVSPVQAVYAQTDSPAVAASSTEVSSTSDTVTQTQDVGTSTSATDQSASADIPTAIDNPAVSDNSSTADTLSNTETTDTTIATDTSVTADTAGNTDTANTTGTEGTTDPDATSQTTVNTETTGPSNTTGTTETTGSNSDAASTTDTADTTDTTSLTADPTSTPDSEGTAPNSDTPEIATEPETVTPDTSNPDLTTDTSTSSTPEEAITQDNTSQTPDGTVPGSTVTTEEVTVPSGAAEITADPVMSVDSAIQEAINAALSDTESSSKTISIDGGFYEEDLVLDADVQPALNGMSLVASGVGGIPTIQGNVFLNNLINFVLKGFNIIGQITVQDSQAVTIVGTDEDDTLQVDLEGSVNNIAIDGGVGNDNVELSGSLDPPDSGGSGVPGASTDSSGSSGSSPEEGVMVSGGSGDDRLTVDFSEGNPLPSQGLGQVQSYQWKFGNDSA